MPANQQIQSASCVVVNVIWPRKNTVPLITSIFATWLRIRRAFGSVPDVSLMPVFRLFSVLMICEYIYMLPASAVNQGMVMMG